MTGKWKMLLPKGLILLSVINCQLVASGLSPSLADILAQTGNCLTKSGFHDDQLGHVTKDSKLYCSAKETLRTNEFTCCCPQSPSDIGAIFWLYRKGQARVKLDWRASLPPMTLDPERPVCFVIHGYLETISWSVYLDDLKHALLGVGCQVVMVDWRHGNALHYFQAAANVRCVGMMVGHAILTWGCLDRSHCIGFSLGGQAVGEAGKYVKRKSGQLIPHCWALDPAGPAFDGGHADMRVTQDDCGLLQVVHTSASSVPFPVNLLIGQLGSRLKSGHCDYWMNGGSFQPGCGLLDMSFIGLLTIIGKLAQESGATTFGDLEVGMDGLSSDKKEWPDISTNLQTVVSCCHYRAPRYVIKSLKGSAIYESRKFVKSTKLFSFGGCYGSKTDHGFPPYDQCSKTMNASFAVRTDS